MADPSQWPLPEPPSIRERAYSVANRLADHASDREIELLCAQLEGRPREEIAALRRDVLEDLELASLSLQILAAAKEIEDKGGLSSAERAYLAATALDEPHEGEESDAR